MSPIPDIPLDFAALPRIGVRHDLHALASRAALTGLHKKGHAITSEKDADGTRMLIAAFRHLERMARLAYLAPDIVRAMLAGTQLKPLTGRSLWRAAALPLTWADQRERFGVTAAKA